MLWILFTVVWLGIVFIAWTMCRAGAIADRRIKQMWKETLTKNQLEGHKKGIIYKNSKKYYLNAD